MQETKVIPARIHFGSETDEANDRDDAHNVAATQALRTGRHADVSSDEEDDHPEFDLDSEDDDVAVLGAPEKKSTKKKGKGKGLSTKVILACGIGFLALVVASGAIVVLKKRNAAVADDFGSQAQGRSVQAAQPRIVDEPPSVASAPAPLVQAASAPAPVVPTVNANAPAPVVVEAPQRQVEPAAVLSSEKKDLPAPVVAPLQTAQPATSNVPNKPETSVSTAAELKDAARASSEAASAATAAAKEVASMKAMFVSLQQRMDRLENDVKTKLSQAPAASSPAPASAVQKPASSTPAAPAKHAPTQQKPAAPQVKPAAARKPTAAAPVEEIISEPVPVRDYWISGIVNNRAFIVHRNADGTESEQSVVVGDRVEGLGKRVLSVDGRDKAVILDGGGRITTTRAR